MALMCGISAGGRRGRTRAGRGAAVLALALVCLAVFGCGRRVPLSELGDSGAVVWVRLVTSDDESVVGQLVSLDAGSMVVAVRHVLEGDLRVRDRGGRALYSGVERVPGELVGVEMEEGVRVAVVHRTFPAVDIESATFHESRGERSLGSIISLLLGPVIGGTLGLIL